MATSRRTNTMTGFLGDIVDDTKTLVDDLLDRVNDVERKGRDAVRDTSSEADSGSDAGDVATLRASLDELTARIDELTRLQNESDLESMTKGELQELADKRGMNDVNQNSQTKDEMIAALRKNNA
jgi:pyruvate-formate lyase